MSSAAQAVANSANAQLSTGPRTPEGKAKSSRNALRHGLTSRDVVLRDDQRRQFAELRDSLLEELDPQGAIETLTFNQLLHAAWNLERFRSLEAGLAVNGLDPVLEESAAKTLDRINRYAARAQRDYYRAIQELRTLQTNRALRSLKLEPEEQTQVPVIASINDLTKRTHAEVQAQAVRMATDMLNYEAATYLRQTQYENYAPAAGSQAAVQPAGTGA